MPVFTPNVALETAEPIVEAEGAPAGRRRFSLVVEDEDGNRSEPSIAVVTVLPPSFRVAVGPGPVDLAYDDRTREVWVLNSGSAERNRGSVSVAGLARRQVLATVVVGAKPSEIALSPAADRRRAVAVNTGDGTVSIIDMQTRQVTATVPVGERPGAVDISADGRWAYVVLPAAVVVVDLLRQTVAKTIPVGAQPARVIFATNGREALVGNSGDGTVSVIDAARQAVSDTVRVGGATASKPQEVALAVETYPAWSANPGNRTGSVIQPDHTVLDFRLEEACAGVAVTFDGQIALFAGADQPLLARVAFEGGRPAIANARLPAPGGGPKGIAISPNDAIALVVHPETAAVSLVTVKRPQLIARLEAPRGPLRTVAAGSFACAICQDDALLAVDWSGVTV
ncbi:MAG: hypothetical protein HY822_05775 [Acidobacteria bacterium]|nr:hypothetical protein [Acidobacteriota bacterium]